jgi:hypothetical protein
MMMLQYQFAVTHFKSIVYFYLPIKRYDPLSNIIPNISAHFRSVPSSEIDMYVSLLLFFLFSHYISRAHQRLWIGTQK